MEDKIKAIIVEHLQVEPKQVTAEASFVDDLGADSLDLAELLLLFEQSFDVRIPADDARSIRTVGTAMSQIASLQRA